MKKTVLTLAQAAYEPPYAEIIEFAVEGGFNLSGVDSDGFSTNDGTEMTGWEEVTDSWYND